MAEQGYVRGGRVGMRLGGTGSVYIDLYFNTGKCCRSEISIDKMFLFTVRGREVGTVGRGLDRRLDVRQPTQEQRAAAEGRYNGVNLDVDKFSLDIDVYLKNKNILLFFSLPR